MQYSYESYFFGGVEMSKESIYNKCMYILFILSIYVHFVAKYVFSNFDIGLL